MNRPGGCGEPGVIAGAGVDVYGTEPADLDNPVFTSPRILCTPHSAALTPDSWARMACAAVEAVTPYAREKNGRA